MEEQEETHPQEEEEAHRQAEEEEAHLQAEEEEEAHQPQEEATPPLEDNLTPRHKPNRTLPTEKY